MSYPSSRFKIKPLQLALLSSLPGLLLTPLGFAADTPSTLAPITVNADLRQVDQQQLTASATILDEMELQDRGATHFGDVLLQTPNVNFSGQSSRPRHLQIRGMGERDEYTGAPNPSVGFAIDGIDLSGIGMAGSLFDVKQVEILRGPQSTRYGASAIAGLVNIQSNEPTAAGETLLETTLGSDRLREIGLANSGALSAIDRGDLTPLYRFSLFKHDSDGFRTNKTLNRTDTNGRDETQARGALRWWANSDTQFDLNLLYANLNNGYDAFSRDNSFTTRSDEPGRDTQKTLAGAFKVTWTGNPSYQLTSITSYADTDANYDYDGDWLVNNIEQNSIASYQSNQQRQNFNQDFRWQSTEASQLFNNTTAWLVGLNLAYLEEDNKRQERFQSCYVHFYGPCPTEGPDIFNADTTSQFTNQKLGLYGQLDQSITANKTLTYALRVEQNRKNFRQTKREFGAAFEYDADGNRIPGSHAPYNFDINDRFSPTETLWGGSITYTHRYNERHTAFASVTRGFKAGGFNTGLGDNENTQFDAETLYNYEIGLRSNYGNLRTATTLFYMDRQNPQFDGYDEINELFVFFTENFDAAHHYGVETQLDWQAHPKLDLFAHLGLLKTDISGTPQAANFALDGREAAHAPNYQYLVGGQYRHGNGWFARLEVQGMDAFYFDNVHNERSGAYTLVNSRVGYETGNFEVYVWAKNLTDERYATRGYFFDHADGDGKRQYVRLGDPRQLGITTRLLF
ncbi:TonB-dependent receptor [Thiomicrospira sp. ALE5]|uniref:TonB-dependent receptor n=1 Tax=Thiomicrospira sp. ALE5 TaxID=748650 RepID=UPI0008E2C0DD|nr:TonB-dependent receptor [Thiomicrospira sp. ALE5]SFR60454.1 Outer membrane receptor proteins, mostly Fe transport [Thiomicrospira sp. ALE5]